MKSIIPDDKPYCRMCGNPQTEVHHVIYGGLSANRKKSDEDGLTIHLCQPCHRKLHEDKKWRGFDRELKKKAEIAWIRHFNSNIEGFIARFGRNYL